MENNKIKKQVRKIVEELFNATFQNSPNGEVFFPYDQEKMDKSLKIFNALSSNQDLYSFPQEQFENGLKIEMIDNTSNVLDVAEKVVKNLKSDINFYSKIINHL